MREAPVASAGVGAAAEASRPLAAGHLPRLDGVRGIAVLTVMILHFTVMRPDSPAEHAVFQATRLGWAGVDLFFVLSGFLITGILVDSRSGGRYFSSFYARRALRIFPLYYVFLLFVLWIWPAISGAAPEPLGPKLAMLAYLGNFVFAFGGWEAVPGHTTHLWSLAIEEQFYLVWPLIVWLVSRASLMRLCIAMIVVSWFARAGMHLAWESGIPGYALLPARMDALAMGALLSLVVREAGWVERLRPVLPRLVIAGIVLLAASMAMDLMLSPGEDAFNPLAMHVQLLAYPAVDLLSVAMVGYAVLPGDSAYGRVLQHRVMRDLGKYSYALYLLHIPLRNLVVSRIFPGGELPRIAGSQLPMQALVLIGASALTFLVALVSWNAFEKHFLRLKDRFDWRSAPAPRPAPRAAPGA